MESTIFSFLLDLITKGSITQNSLILSILLVLLFIVYYFIKPMFNKMNTIPSKDEIGIFFSDFYKKDDDKINEFNSLMSTKLNDIIETLEEIEELDKDNYKDTKELKRDIEHIKQILNQFQGHLMYSRNDFGNKELR